MQKGNWCTSSLKPPLRIPDLCPKRTVVPTTQAFSESPKNEGRKINIVRYLGIAADEPKRIAKHIGNPNVILPLVEIGWEEDLCGLISGYQNLLSPSYETATRDGCWFCFVVAAPVAWYITSRWLEQFANRIALPWWIYLVALALVLVVIVGLVTLRSLKAATENPADVIRLN